VEPPKPAPLPPPGKAVTLSMPDFIEKNFIGGSQPQKVSSVGCSGLANTQLWQIREPWNDREHAASDALLYVVGGEGTLRLDGRDSTLQAGTFASVPRGMNYSLTRRGRNPLIVLATIVGEACTP
jgi:mannose-6-phosphate isomerase-like protein (cupin superfamily)